MIYNTESVTSWLSWKRLLPANGVIPPLTRIWYTYARNIDRVVSLRWVSWSGDSLNMVYSDEDVEEIKGAYGDIPKFVREATMGHVFYELMVQAAFWTKSECFFYSHVRYRSEHSLPFYPIPVVKDLREASLAVKVILEQVSNSDQIPEDVDLPTSHDRHAEYTARFSIEVEDIPWMRWRHVQLTGISDILHKFEVVEAKGVEFVEFCVRLRDYLDTHFTIHEKWILR
jgi:hypothetical protein